MPQGFRDAFPLSRPITLSMKAESQEKSPRRYILFIDDNFADYHMLLESMRLIHFDGEIEWVDDGQDALNLLSTVMNPPDLIILDINLPNVNGHTILQYLKSNKNKKKIPVIMFSTSDSHADINLAYANYANSYVVKPGTLDEYVNFAETVKTFWLGVASLPKHRQWQALD